MKNDFNTALEFVKKYHEGIFYANNVPAWHHLARVANRLDTVLKTVQEGSPEERHILVVSSLGHDLLEDTKVQENEVKKIFGDQGFEFILGMTNTWGDDDVDPYVKKVSLASEEVKLIKLADLCDNISSVTYNIAVLGKKWVVSYFLPIVKPMKEMMLKTNFNKYKRAGESLKFMVDTAYEVLSEELLRFD